MTNMTEMPDNSSISGSSGSSFETVNINKVSKEFKVKFSFTQAPICRPFMDPLFFSLRGWRLSKEWFAFFNDKTVSGGEDDPNGVLVTYPIMALFIKDIELMLVSIFQYFAVCNYLR